MSTASSIMTQNFLAYEASGYNREPSPRFKRTLLFIYPNLPLEPLSLLRRKTVKLGGRPVTLRHHTMMRHNEHYALVATPRQGAVEGLVYPIMSRCELGRLMKLDGMEYALRGCKVELEDGEVASAFCFKWVGKSAELEALE